MITRAIIIDDEPPARNKIRRFLESRQDVEVLAEAGDGEEAVGKILELRPDLIFLDIQMPRGDGFDVLREVYPSHKPRVIFTTAFDAYALRAFEVEALDYLLKPFTADRFHAAVERALRAGAGEADTAAKVARLLNDSRAAANRVQRVLVRQDGRMIFVKTSEIEWVEAEEKYVILHARNQRHIVRQTIAALETRLAPAAFVRIHRGYLINIAALQEIAPLIHGDCEVVLKSGARLNVGRNYKERLLQAMNGFAVSADGEV